MAFDQSTRARLQKFVTNCRVSLSEELTRQLQSLYGLDPSTGHVAELDELTHLDNRQRQTAHLLREMLAHYVAATPGKDETACTKQALDRIVREQAFTVLNRLAALRMAEARGFLMESIAQGQNSKGFQLYRSLVGTAHGETGDAYSSYLFSLFDEFALDMAVLFDRHSPQGRLFPREGTLLEVLEQINHPDIEHLWAEDETIGWIYQYFNSQEERKKMRKESQAPRNSRELAVRNQFFTPRYVVEFLVDNTLGRIWFDATNGTTSLYDRCQYLLVKPEELEEKRAEPTPRTLRDPRTFKLLDPACGSMHFGLYAFDLFLEIYREAWMWEQEQGPGSLDVSTESDADLKPLGQTYEDEVAYLRDVPRLIIEHNIYGVDIDPRAAQIATLALWLRAQRAWHDADVKAQQRPIIGQGHVVAAIAPPAEKELREQFAEQLDSKDAELFDKTLQLLRNLPDLGVLLQMEQELPKLIKQIYGGTDGGLFAAQEQETWYQAEQRLREALNIFTERVSSSYQSQLFALDALQGLRLIDLTREMFDVVVMNPPFGQPTEAARVLLKAEKSDGWKDIYAGFFERAITLKRKDGLVGAITSSQFFHTRQMKKLREDMIVNERPLVIIDLGKDVLDDAAVQTALTILGDPRNDGVMAYADLFETQDKDKELLQRVINGSMQYLPLKDIAAIPGRPMCLHAAPKVLHQWRLDKPLDPQTATVATGNHTFDDERFLRIYTEVVPEVEKYDWIQYEKGGEFQPFFSPSSIFLRWSNSGAQLRALNTYAYGSDAQVMQSSKYWGEPGLCFNHVSSVGFSPRVLPRGTIFSSESISIFLNSELKSDPESARKYYLALLGFLSSTVAQELVYVFGRFRKIENRAVSGIPISLARLEPWLDQLADLASEGISISRKLSSFDETSPCFVVPEKLSKATLKNASRSSLKQRSVELYTALDRICGLITEISDEDVLAEKRSKLVGQFSLLRADHSKKDLEDEVLSWAFGVVVGRFDWRLATGETIRPPEPDPFDPLPTKSPGMLPDDSNPFHRHGGVLVDDEGHQHDLPRLITQVLETVDANASLDVRRWLRKEFFPFHLKRYSKSRRKAPIYWPLSTPSGNYTLWLYYPGLTNQTLFTAVNDFVEPKLNSVRNDLNSLRSKSNDRSKQEDSELEKLADLEQELADFRDTLLDIAPRFRPNHDDGVQITASPLWSLFRHKPWQEVLKDTWKQLENGDYDWAYLALNYWPARVLRKCSKDRSLAIAHDVEPLFWEEVEVPVIRRGKDTGETKLEWRPKDLSKSELEALIKRTIEERGLQSEFR